MPHLSGARVPGIDQPVKPIKNDYEKLLLLPLMLLSLVLPAACGESGDDPAPSGGHPGQPETPGGNEGGDPGETSLKIGITVGSRTITATMEDNAAARDFLSRLPLEVTLSDYSNAEKIFYPSPALTTSKVARGCTPAPGDITIYVPWGNVAIFYKTGRGATT